jgi:hypothetical protein
MPKSTLEKYNRAGGPAFPVPDQCEHGGMTLRDYFAAQAMTALLANAMNAPVSITSPTLPDVAVKAYKMADAMLDEMLNIGDEL